MDTDAIDLKYAREAAEFLNTCHTEVIITKEQVIQALPQVILTLGTYDITTIRASVGMYLICQAIREQSISEFLWPAKSLLKFSDTNIRILLQLLKNFKKNP